MNATLDACSQLREVETERGRPRLRGPEGAASDDGCSDGVRWDDGYPESDCAAAIPVKNGDSGCAGRDTLWERYPAVHRVLQRVVGCPSRSDMGIGELLREWEEIRIAAAALLE